MKKILFPTDYSPASTAALRYAVSLAQQSQATLLVAYVQPPSVPPVGTSNVLHEEQGEAELTARLQGLAGDDQQALRYEIRQLRGDAAEQILRLAREEHVDAIVMATAGRSGLRRVLMGSVAEAVVRDAACPVLTLKEPQPEKAAVGPLPVNPQPAKTETVEFTDPGAALIEAEASRAQLLLQQAIAARATDVHLYPAGDAVEVRLRIDGRLEHHCRLPTDVGHHLISQLKVLAELDISDPFHPQEGWMRAHAQLGGYEVRITSVPIVGGQSVALRLLNRERLLRPLDSLGLAQASRERIAEMLRNSGGEGVVLVTGPTNSGKTTTAYSMVHALDDGHRNIVTIEDPPEYNVPSFRQLAADQRHGITLTSGLRTLLRMDPDIVLLGEIRDVEAAEIAMRAASSGRFVFSTIHTRDVASTVTALRDLHVDNRSLAGNLTGIISQRLLRRLCAHCRRETPLDAAGAALFEAEELEPPDKVFTAVGCDKCRQAGYFERVGVFEVLGPDQLVREAIEQGTSENELRQLIRSRDTPSLRADALAKVREGITSVDELQHMTWGRLPLSK